jgi:hypothetical protein
MIIHFDPDARGRLLFLSLGFPFQSLSNTLVPAFHGLVWSLREALFRQHSRKHLPCLWVLHFENCHRFLQERDMFFWTQQ